MPDANMRDECPGDGGRPVPACAAEFITLHYF